MEYQPRKKGTLHHRRLCSDLPALQHFFKMTTNYRSKSRTLVKIPGQNLIGSSHVHFFSVCCLIRSASEFMLVPESEPATPSVEIFNLKISS